ncbi:MAG: hypothetical protein WCH04_22330 [Gammaproteobacteria bacterium]
MAHDGKLGKLLKTGRNPQEVEDWLFSLIPLGVAFVFFFIFLLPMDIPRKDVVMVIGTAAGFSGLQSYWIYRGWRKNHVLTIVLGLIGIALVMGLVRLYLTLAA